MLYLFLFFLAISVVNVILSTLKSLCTIRCGRGITIIMNVLCYGFYTVVVKNTATLPLTITVIGTMVANALGVWLSYVIMDKFSKDRLWKIELAVNKRGAVLVRKELQIKEISFSEITVGNWVMFNCYCDTQQQTAICKRLAKTYFGKISAYESQKL